MKNTKNIVIAIIAISSLFITTGMANASFDMHSGINNVKEHKNQMRQEMRNGIKTLRTDKREFVKNHRGMLRGNLKNFKQLHKGEMREALKGVKKEVKSELKKEKTEFRESIKNLIVKLKDKNIKFEEKLKIKNEIEKLRENHFNKVKLLLTGNTKALNVLEARKQVFEENRKLRNMISEKRREFREKRSEQIARYKELIIKKIGSRIDKMDIDKLKKLDARVDKIYKKYENNKKITETHRNKILALLEGLKDTIKSKIDMLSEETDSSTSDILDEVLEQ